MNLKQRGFQCIAALALIIAALVGFAGPANASTSAPNISSGQSGFKVQCVQAAINASPAAPNPRLAVDGKFGPATLAAVKNFQSYYGLARDGIVGPRTGDQVYYFDYYYYTSNCYYHVPTTY